MIIQSINHPNQRNGFSPQPAGSLNQVQSLGVLERQMRVTIADGQSGDGTNTIDSI
jgi:hypothetical protein